MRNKQHSRDNRYRSSQNYRPYDEDNTGLFGGEYDQGRIQTGGRNQHQFSSGRGYGSGMHGGSSSLHGGSSSYGQGGSSYGGSGSQSGMSGGGTYQGYGSQDYGSSGSSSRSSSSGDQGIWGSVKSYFGKGPKGYQRSDERIEEEVNEALYNDPYIDATEIEVSVKNGEVTLSGTVEERRMKRLAEDCVEEISGVRDVRNELRVQSSSGTGQSGSSMSSRSSMDSDDTEDSSSNRRGRRAS